MIKELSYLRESVRIDLDCDCRFSESYRKSVLKMIDKGIKNIENGRKSTKTDPHAAPVIGAGDPPTMPKGE